MSDEVTISDPIGGTRWVYCGKGDHGMAVRVTDGGLITPSLSCYSAEDIPNLIAALQKAAELAGKP